MFGFGEASEKYNEIENTQDVTEEHKASWTHQAIAAAAGFSAMRAYNQHCEANGQPQSYELMKELLAGFAAAATTRLVETKGMDWIDPEETKNAAVAQTEAFATEKFGEGQVGGFTPDLS